MTLPDVTDASLPTALAQHRNLVVDAWAPWCQPCLRLEPILHELARENEGKLTIARLNTDDNPRASQELGIMGMPTLVLFRDGRRVGQIVGLQPKAAIAQQLARVFA